MDICPAVRGVPGLAGVTGAGIMLMSGEVHRATLPASDEVAGMVSVQQGISVADALVRLRATMRDLLDNAPPSNLPPRPSEPGGRKSTEQTLS